MVCYLGFFWWGGVWVGWFVCFKQYLNGFSSKFGDSLCPHLKNRAQLGKEGSKPTKATKMAVFVDQTRRDN